MKACNIGFYQCKTRGCVQWRTNVWVGWCEQMKLRLVDVKLRVDRAKKAGHFWDGKTFSKSGHPLSLCGGSRLFPRDPVYFISPNEMKEVPFCQKCLSMIEN